MADALNKQLIEAIKKKNLQSIKTLLSQGASAQNKVKVRDTSRVTTYEHPMHVAVQTQNVTILAYLLETCKVNFFNTTVNNLQDGRNHTLIHNFDAFSVAVKSCMDVAVLVQD